MAKVNPHIPMLAKDFGIVFPGAQDYRNPDIERLVAMDAAPTNVLQNQLVTVSNAGIPAYLANYVDPEMTRILTAPMEAADIMGEVKKGDWTTFSATFPIVEAAGETSSYGDYNNNGLVSVNTNFEPRQSYSFQTFTKWGDLELEMAGLAKIDWAAEQNIASALIIAKQLNKFYFNGVAGLDNYGLLNDPSLNPSIAPTGAWSGLTGLQIWTDILNLYKQLQSQLEGNVSMRDNMTLAMSPVIEPYLLTAMQNVYGNSNVIDMLHKSFPNLEVKTAMEYGTNAGQLVQLIVHKVQGQTTGYCAFTEKMRAHAIVRDTTSVYQKKSAGVWGTIIKLPAAIASMIGV